MSTFQTVAQLEDLPENEGHIVRHGPLQIALFRRGDTVRAIDNICPHAGASLAHGYLEDDAVVCPWHCWEFDISTGKCATVEGMDVETFEVKIENGQVQIALPE